MEAKQSITTVYAAIITTTHHRTGADFGGDGFVVVVEARGRRNACGARPDTRLIGTVCSCTLCARPFPKIDRYPACPKYSSCTDYNIHGHLSLVNVSHYLHLILSSERSETPWHMQLDR